MSVSARLRVAVVGCGIGGPAAAIFLARAGHEVTVYDRAEELGPKGAGILLAPTALFVLDRLHLLQQAIDHGSRIQRLEGQTVSGRKIMDLRYRHLSTGLFGLGIHRGALFSILHEAMRAEKVQIKTDWHVAQVLDNMVESSEGLTEGPYDLIIVADGARSLLRNTLSLETKSVGYDYGALWISVTNWGEFPDNVLRQFYKGTKRMMGLLPCGRLDGGEGRQISLFWSIRLKDVGAWHENGLDRWKLDVLDLMPQCEELLSQIESEEQVTIASYHDVRTWSTIKGNVVVMGDAAHASSPQLGQGASLGLFDALVLCQCLEREPNVMAALLQYRDLRKRHVRFYQLASKWMTPFFQSGQSYLAWPRDLLLGPACRIPWLQREMVATMAGIKQGAFDRIPQEEQIMLMGARFAFGGLVKDDRQGSSDLVRR